MGSPMKFALTCLIATAGFVAGPAIAEVSDGDKVMEIHRGGLAYDAAGERLAALSMFGQACDMGLPAACTMAGQVEHETASNEKDHIRAARMFAKACRAGDDLACERTGMALGPLSRANSTEPDGVMTFALLAMGEECRHPGGEQACVDAAQLLGAQDGPGIDLFAARAYGARACEKEASERCTGVAMLPAGNRTSDETFQRSNLLCATGWAGGCDALLEPLMEESVGVDAKRHLDALVAACDERVGIACADLGLFYSQGPESARNPGAAYRYMRYGCDAFVAKACFAFGVMHKKGIGGRIDETRAVSLVGHACELGSPKACATLARIAGESETGTAAGIAAAEALRRACRLGDTSSCTARNG